MGGDTASQCTKLVMLNSIHGIDSNALDVSCSAESLQAFYCYLQLPTPTLFYNDWTLIKSQGAKGGRAVCHQNGRPCEYSTNLVTLDAMNTHVRKLALLKRRPCATSTQVSKHLSKRIYLALLNFSAYLTLVILLAQLLQ